MNEPKRGGGKSSISALIKPAPTGEDANPASNQPTAVKETFHPAQKITATSAQARNDLSDSGAQSSQGEIDRCGADKKWEEALKSTLHTVQALPENEKFRVTLEEIPALAEGWDKFRPLFRSYTLISTTTKRKRPP